MASECPVHWEFGGIIDNTPPKISISLYRELLITVKKHIFHSNQGYIRDGYCSNQ